MNAHDTSFNSDVVDGPQYPEIFLSSKMLAAQGMEVTLSGVWKLYFSRQVQSILLTIALIGAFGLAFFGSDGPNIFLFYSLNIAIAPILLGFLFVSALHLIARGTQKYDAIKGLKREVVFIPDFIIPMVVSPLFIGLSMIARSVFDPSYEVSWLGALIATVFLVAIFEAVVRFIVSTVVPSALSLMSDENYLICTGVRRNETTQSPRPKLSEAAAMSGPAMVQVGDHALLRQDVLMLEAQGNYVNVVTSGRSILVRGPLANLLEQIDGLDGMQVHRSRWVAIHACKMLEKKGAELFIHLTNGDMVKVVKARHSEVRDYFRNAAELTQPDDELNERRLQEE